MVVAAVVEVQGGGLAGAEGGAMPRQGLGGHGVEIGALDARGGAGEILTHHVVVQSDGLELLGRMIAAQRRDAHLRDRLEDALLDGGDVLVGQLIGGRTRPAGRRRRASCGWPRRPCRDSRRGAVAAEEAEVHHFAGLAAFDHDARPCRACRRAKRPWCKAAVASRLGMAAILGETPRSLRITSDAPSRTARSAPSINSASALRSARRPRARRPERGSAASPPRNRCG